MQINISQAFCDRETEYHIFISTIPKPLLVSLLPIDIIYDDMIRLNNQHRLAQFSFMLYGNNEFLSHFL